MADGPEPRADDVIPARVFLGIGAFVAVMAAIYWFTAYEDAGTVMLAAAAVLALWYGIYLWLRRQRATEAVPGPSAEPSESSQGEAPEGSVWPLVVGLGAAGVANGLAVSLWILIPGLLVAVLGVAGLVRESRRSPE